MKKRSKTINTTTGKLSTFKTIKLGHTIFDKNDPEAYDEILVPHNFEKESFKIETRNHFYFYGIFRDNDGLCIKDFNHNHNGEPPSKKSEYIHTL